MKEQYDIVADYHREIDEKISAQTFEGFTPNVASRTYLQQELNNTLKEDLRYFFMALVFMLVICTFYTKSFFIAGSAFLCFLLLLPISLLCFRYVL